MAHNTPKGVALARDHIDKARFYLGEALRQMSSQSKQDFSRAAMQELPEIEQTLHRLYIQIGAFV